MPAGKPIVRPPGCRCDLESTQAHNLDCVALDTHSEPPPPPSKLESLVAEMRRLGVTEYQENGVKIVLGTPTTPATERTADEQQRIRDERERQVLERQHRVRFGASSSIGPSRQGVK